MGLAIGRDGNLLAADTNNHRIQKLTPEGKFLTKWGEQGNKEGLFIRPHAITVDSQGNLYIADTSNQRLQKFSPNGKFLAQWNVSSPLPSKQRTEPTTIAFDKRDRLFFPDARNQRVLIFSTEGQVLGEWKEWKGGQFSRPLGVAADKDGCIYVTDMGNHAVYKFKVE